MRNISTELENAILNKSSSSVLVRATIDPSRTFFESADSTNAYDAGDYSLPTDTPVGQCMIFSRYMKDTGATGVYTFIVDKDTGAVYIMEKGDGTPHSLGISANVDTKPSAVDQGNGTAKLYYWNGGLKVSTINLSTWGVSNTTGISIDSLPASWGVLAGSPTALNDEQIVLCYKTSKGGLGVAFKDGPFWYHWNQRFMSPNALSETAWTIYTSAISINNKLYVYSTDVKTGQVRAVEFSPTKAIWTDIFVALPADLSRFDISNAVYANGYVHLAGQFHRTGDHVTARSYSLILRSKDGKTFSWDKFTLLSEEGFRFHIAIDNTEKLVYASERNSVGIADMSYYFTVKPTHRVILAPLEEIRDPDVTFYSSVVSFNTSVDGGSMHVASANEEAMNHQTIHKDNRIEVEIGYRTTNGIEYVKYGTYIIDKVDLRYKDGNRSLVLALINEGVWKTSKIAFPFYGEILSKTSQFDNCDSLDQMYVQPCLSADNLEYLAIDFWNSEKWETTEVAGTPMSWYTYWNVSERERTFTGTVKGKTIDLKNHPLMTKYPTITGAITAKLYGWETGIDRPQSTYALYVATAPEDDLTDITITQGTLISTYNNFPEELYSPAPVGTAAGDYPMEFSFTGLTTGHKVLYFGVTATNNTAGTSWIYLERIEVTTGIKFAYSCLTSSTPWSLETPPNGDREYLVSPDTGLQNIMFTTKPYSTFNFNIAAEFGYDEGDSPLSPGTTAWGVVGMASDGLDYICARYCRQSSEIQLCLMRDGKTTIMAKVTSSPVYDIMMDHRNGTIRIWSKSGNTWVGPVLTYHYDEITYGVISTSDTEIMHTGIYSAVYPPSFIATAFAEPYSDGICMTKDQTINALLGFPNTGAVIIDKQKYSYTSKAIKTSLGHNQTYGPYQLRQVSNLGGMGLENALYKPANPTDLLAGLLIGQSNHHTWLMTGTDWDVVHSTGGENLYLRNRSHHFSDSAIVDQYYNASLDDKVFLNHGLLGIELEDDTAYYHSDGSLCSLWSTDKIWVKKVVATEINHDATVEDMLRYLCHVASIEAEFPGAWISDSLAIGTTPVTLAPNKELFPGGCDIQFSIPKLSSTDSIYLELTNLKYTDTEETFKFGIHGSSDNKLEVSVETTSLTISERIKTPLIATHQNMEFKHDIRILVHDDFVSIYSDGVTLATFALGSENLEWPELQIVAKMSASKSLTVTDLYISELFDWREAIYIESELSVSSSIGSVIQERPIDTYLTSEGDLSFSYYFERDEITYSQEVCKRILGEHNETHQNSDNAGSDALVYYEDVVFEEYSKYAIEDGFNTRVFRLSNLETGAKLAARLLLEKAFEKQHMHSFKLRPDLRLEIGDIANFTYVLSGTGTVVTARGIVESIGISVEEGKHQMNLTARNKEVA